MTNLKLEEDTRTYSVVVNDEGQYSVWLAEREVPNGWRVEGKSGPKDECLKYIAEVWTDMRPISLREWSAEQEPKKDEGASS